MLYPGGCLALLFSASGHKALNKTQLLLSVGQRGRDYLSPVIRARYEEISRAPPARGSFIGGGRIMELDTPRGWVRMPDTSSLANQGQLMIFLICAFITVIAILGTTIVFRSSPWIEPWGKSLAIVQTILTIAAVIIAAFYYFYERPRSAKIKIDQSVSTKTLPNQYLLVLAEVSITNQGGSAIDLRKDKFGTFIQQVTPLPKSIEKSLIWSRTPHGIWEVERSSSWEALAESEDKLPSFLEAGETDNLYFRTTILCQKDLSIYYTTIIDKPSMIEDAFSNRAKLQWIKQTFVDVSKKCTDQVGGRDRTIRTPGRRIRRLPTTPKSATVQVH